ncbi:MAG: alpha/beta fold hydrolase [Alphaproteobacteria bacterium]|nr:MAG: alpha/beta fold hydrolase [Alphaproteobacteria bacterium]
MAHFTHQGLTIHFEDVGEGVPVLLVHGFASNAKLNWEVTGWVPFLLENGCRVITLDLRGHGKSDKPHDPALYTSAAMKSDILALLDHLEVSVVHGVGYSMGAMLLLDLLPEEEGRFMTLTLGGVGDVLFEGGRGDAEDIAAGLEAEDPSSVSHETALSFRLFADSQKADRLALAACMRGRRYQADPYVLAAFAKPVLVAAGERDTIIGNPARLAEAFPKGAFLSIPRRDHLRAVSEQVFKQGFLDFIKMNDAA